MKIDVIETPSLGNRSYILSDDGMAAVVDPQRDIDRVLERTEALGVRITHVLETHTHNDYVSGGLDLARQAGATYVLPRSEENQFDFCAVDDGDDFSIGTCTIRVISTPGHTDNHVAYFADDHDSPAVFTGGSLLYGSVGRTDLVAKARTRELTARQFAGLRALGERLPPETTVLPTHGFGSFCSTVSSSGESASPDPRFGAAVSTIGQERTRNLVFTSRDESEFVQRIITSLSSPPSYYIFMAPRNRAGAGPINLAPAHNANGHELQERVGAGEWVVDLRSARDFASNHIAGTLNAPIGQSFVTYLAWSLPWGSPVTLLGDTQEMVGEAQRQLARVGIDRPAAQAVGGIDVWGERLPRGHFQVARFRELASSKDRFVLDVRRTEEHTQGLRVQGSVNIPLHDLPSRVDELPVDRGIWVHCASGYRAALACSLLKRAGRSPVMINDKVSRIRDTVLEAAAG